MCCDTLNSLFVFHSYQLSVVIHPQSVHIAPGQPSCLDIGDGGGKPSSVISLEVASVGGHSHGHPASPIGVGSLWEDTDPRSLGCQRGLALADLGCMVDHLGPTPANLSPPSSFAVSCDLKALWPGVLGC